MCLERCINDGIDDGGRGSRMAHLVNPNDMGTVEDRGGHGGLGAGFDHGQIGGDVLDVLVFEEFANEHFTGGTDQNRQIQGLKGG